MEKTEIKKLEEKFIEMNKPDYIGVLKKVGILILIFFVMYASGLFQSDETKRKALIKEQDSKSESIINLANLEEVDLGASRDVMRDKYMESLRRSDVLKQCIEFNKSRSGSLDLAKPCSEFTPNADIANDLEGAFLDGVKEGLDENYEKDVTLRPDELFYTTKTSDNCYVTQGEQSHFKTENGGMLATDVGCGGKVELYAPDYKDKSIAYIVKVKENNLLGNYVELHFGETGYEKKWVIGHVKTDYIDNMTINTGEKLGIMNASGALGYYSETLKKTIYLTEQEKKDCNSGKKTELCGYHSHIELWAHMDGEWKNVSYTKRSANLNERREKINTHGHSHELEPKHPSNSENIEIKTYGDFSYTPVTGEGNLNPESPKYAQAAEGFDIPWQAISAIHCTETFDINLKTCTRHTKSPTSSAGAQGCMQFMPKTWTGWTPSSVGYGIDGDGDGKADITNCKDSLRSAANYLNDNYKKTLRNGGTEEEALKNAFYQYNHANWYVNRAYNIYNTLIK